MCPHPLTVDVLPDVVLPSCHSYVMLGDLRGRQSFFFSCYHLMSRNINLILNLLFQTRDEDVNRDGRPDMLHYNIEIPLLDTEHAFSTKLILIFDYRLYVSTHF